MAPSSSSSSAINIPKRKRKQHFHRNSTDHEQPSRQAAESPTTSGSMMSSSGRSAFGNEISAKSNGKAPAYASPTTVTAQPVPIPTTHAQIDLARRRRSSFLSESLERSEFTIVDVGSEDNPRLITCIKSSQGFDWNQELFLPSYIDYDFEQLERRQEPVQDIIVTDEEAAAFFPS